MMLVTARPAPEDFAGLL